MSKKCLDCKEYTIDDEAEECSHCLSTEFEEDLKWNSKNVKNVEIDT